MKKQLIASLLFVSLIASVSCGDNSTAPETTKAPDQTSDTAEETIPDNLPSANYNGYEFRLFVPESAATSYTPESETGEIVDEQDTVLHQHTRSLIVQNRKLLSRAHG